MTTMQGKGVASGRHPDPDDEPVTAAGACDDATVIAPPTKAGPELAWSKDGEDNDVWDYPTTAWWSKLRQRVTGFFHPFPDEARVAAIDDYDDAMDDDAADDDDDDDEPIEIPDASWAACFAASAPFFFVGALLIFIIVVCLGWQQWAAA